MSIHSVLPGYLHRQARNPSAIRMELNPSVIAFLLSMCSQSASYHHFISFDLGLVEAKALVNLRIGLDDLSRVNCYCTAN